MTKIPESGNPPSRLVGSAAVYDPILNQILTFGGLEYRNSILINSLISFSLNSLAWSEIKPQSSFIPEGREICYMSLRSDRKLLIFFGLTASGVSSDVYSFSLETGIWKIEELVGDAVSGRDNPGFTFFVHSGIEYVSFYGGFTLDGLDDNLYM